MAALYSYPLRGHVVQILLSRDRIMAMVVIPRGTFKAAALAHVRLYAVQSKLAGNMANQMPIPSWRSECTIPIVCSTQGGKTGMLGNVLPNDN